MKSEVEEKAFEEGVLAKMCGLFLDSHPLIFLPPEITQSHFGGRGEVEIVEMFQVTGA